MCQHRFGVVNRLYQELMCRGYTDIIAAGVTSQLYLNDWVDGMRVCMFNWCDNPYPIHTIPNQGTDPLNVADDCQLASNGKGCERILSWMHDFDAVCEPNSTYPYNMCVGLIDEQNETYCGTGTGDDGLGMCNPLNVYEDWGIVLRDFLVLGKDGEFRYKINFNTGQI